MPIEIPKRQTTAPPETAKTDVGAADILSKASAADFGQRRQVVMSLSQMSDALMQKSEESFAASRRAFRSIAEIDRSAAEARKKSDAQQIVFESKLALDDRLQALGRDASVKPLEMASRADALIQAETKKAIEAGAALGADMRDFVRDKMGAYRVEKVPQFRRDGYKKETDEILAGVEHRNFLRQAEMNEPGVSMEKRRELATEMIDEYAALEGIHMSREDIQEKIAGVIGEAQEHAWYDTLLADPKKALAMLGELRVEPEKRASMRSNAISILNAEEAARDRAEARYERNLNKRAKALVNEATNRIIQSNGEWNPASLANNPQAAATMRNGELEGLVRFHQWFVKRNDGESLTMQQAADIADLRIIAHSGEYTNEGFKTLIMSRSAAGVDIPAKEVIKLIDANDTAVKRLEGMDRSDYKEHRDRGDGIIKGWFDPLGGPFAPMAEQFGAQIRLAEMNARTEYHTRLQGMMQEAEKLGGNPFDHVNPDSLALEIVSKNLVSTMPMYKSYIGNVDNEALRKAMVPDAGNFDPKSFNRTLIQERDAGRISNRGLEAALSYNKLMNKLISLTPVQQAMQGQPSVAIPTANPVATETTREAAKAKAAAKPFRR